VAAGAQAAQAAIMAVSRGIDLKTAAKTHSFLAEALKFWHN